MARKHMNELGRGLRDSFPEAVKTSDDLAKRNIRWDGCSHPQISASTASFSRRAS